MLRSVALIHSLFRNSVDPYAAPLSPRENLALTKTKIALFCFASSAQHLAAALSAADKRTSTRPLVQHAVHKFSRAINTSYRLNAENVNRNFSGFFRLKLLYIPRDNCTLLEMYQLIIYIFKIIYYRSLRRWTRILLRRKPQSSYSNACLSRYQRHQSIYPH